MRNIRTFLYDAYWPPFTPDVDRYDPEHAVRTAVEMNANALRMASIGKWAVYPSEIMPMHPDLDGRDLLGETINHAKRAGVKVIVYIPVGHALPYRLLSELRPEWQFYLTEERPYDPSCRYSQLYHFGGEPIVPTCLLGPYNQDILKVVSEVIENYDCDAIYLDGPYQGWCNQDKICQCPTCRTDFEKDTGLALPRTPEASGDTGHVYLDWNRKKLLQTLVDIKAVASQKSLPVIVNRTAAMLLGSTYELKMLKLSDGFLIEAEGGGIEGVSLGVQFDKMVWNYTTPHTHWPRLTCAEKEFRSAAEGYRSIALGATPIVSYAGRLLLDRSHDTPITTLFADMKMVTPVLEDSKLIRQACVISPACEREYESEDEKIFQGDKRAYTLQRLLLDAGVQAMVLPATYLAEEPDLSQFSLVVLPSSVQLTQAQTQSILAYVRNGGSLFAAGNALLPRSRSDAGVPTEVAECCGVRLVDHDVEMDELVNTHLWGESAYDTYLDWSLGKGSGRLPQSDHVWIEACGGDVFGHTVLWQNGEKSFPALVRGVYGEGRTVYLNSAFETSCSECPGEWLSLFFAILKELNVSPLIRISDQNVTWSLSESDDTFFLQLVNNTMEMRNVDVELLLPQIAEIGSVLSPVMEIDAAEIAGGIKLTGIELKHYECLDIRKGQ